MGSRIRILGIAALLAILAATAGCIDGGGDAGVEDTPDPAALQENVATAMEDVETVTFSMEIETSGQSSGTISGDAVMDLAEEKARIDMTIESMMGEQEATQYLVGDTAYVHANDQWIRMNMSALDPWGQNNQLAAQQNVLENGSVEVTGTDTIDGREVWNVSIQPDPEQIRSLMAQQSGFGSLPENVEIESVEANQYVDVETDRVRRVEMDVEMQYQGQTVTNSMNVTFHSFDEPVDISLPDAAENATDVGSFGSGGQAAAAVAAR